MDAFTKMMDRKQDVPFPVWKKNSNGCGYSINVKTPSLAKLIRAVSTRLQNGQSTVKILEIGVGDSHVLALEYLNDSRVQLTFVDPGSDFGTFPQRSESSFRYIQGYFPQDLNVKGCKDEKFDFVYSSRCIHCNTPQRMIDTIRTIRDFLSPVHGRFVLETTGMNSAFYQEKAKLMEYFKERKDDEYPGLITETEFLKHWPEWRVGAVTLMDSSARLRNMLYDAGFEAIEYEEKYIMSDQEFFVIVGY